MYYRQMTNQFSHRRLVSFFIAFILLSGVLPGLKVQAAARLQPVEDPVVIVIDPGHGGENEGTIENGFQEKSMTMTTAMAMYEELRQYDNVEVYLTRTEDQDMSLKERAEFAAAVQADFLFSIHYNASVEHDLFGSEVWISAIPPLHAYGYQFGMIHLRNMKEMGLFLRGVKTRQREKGDDYYGIIRESAALDIPAVIIEHCHVDEGRDVPFCDDEEELIAFGKADARSAAQYFGLKSTSLSADYSAEGNLADIGAGHLIPYAMKDETEPEVCALELVKSDFATGEMILNVSAADYDGMLLYYDYSLDGGQTYSALEPWPGSNALDYSYTDSFTLSLQIPSGVQPDVVLRAYNLFDLPAQSNPIHSLSAFRYGEDASPEDTLQRDAVSGEAGETQAGDDHFLPSGAGTADSREPDTFAIFIGLCVFIVVVILTIVIGSQLSAGRRRRRRIQQRKDAGKNRNHPR